ncbi:tetratricopeptide repeat protein [Arsenicibacter rosenii]|uniref:UDP-N-acetylglucosamine-peptide N-acetylglucosaminyltransferase n=1 Tax=Arsenicibacter rosenii TaxID=1750698 RepID=A0A1S2VL93_9BACT|nr:tetratricopeptide repeat protein [Arsenicibacter rosenii]OIN59532.1 UDP-N-acetylglucosamine-peptide N-acetylglucosaminyltransferase [Arsenicibacter rosenii]
MCLGDAFKYIVLIGLVLSLVACGDNERRQARIPPLPDWADSSRSEATLRALTRAINQSSSPYAYAKRAALYLSMEKRQEALEDIDEAISRNANVGSFYLIRSQVYRLMKQIPKALENAQRAEILGVDTPELYTILGDLYQQQKQFGKARLHIARALQMAPYDGEAYFFQGIITAYQGDTGKAISLYEHSLSLKPRYLATYNQLSNIYRALGNIEQALAYNEKASTYFPDNAELWYTRGLTLQSGGKLEEALGCYRQTVKLQTNYYQAHFQSGLIYQKWKSYFPALANFQKVQQYKPDYPRIDTYIGQCQEQVGQLDAAIASYTKASQLDPGDQLAVAGLYRAQRRQMGYYYNSQQTTGGTDNNTPAINPADTARLRIQALPSRTRIPSRGDSINRTIKPIGQN